MLNIALANIEHGQGWYCQYRRTSTEMTHVSVIWDAVPPWTEINILSEALCIAGDDSENCIGLEKLHR